MYYNIKTTLNFMKHKYSGLSLIESMLSLTILTIVSLSLIQWYSNIKEKELNKKFADEISLILYATDRRLFIDQFKDNDFSQQIYNGSKIDLNSTFISFDNNCGESDGWKPNGYSDISLISCGMWENKVPYNLNIDVKIKKKKDYITKVYYDYSFKEEKQYEKFKGLLIELNKNIKNNMVPLHSGSISSYFIDSENNRINLIECSKLKFNCKLRTEFKSSPALLLEDELL